jgi:hypothetical protein
MFEQTDRNPLQELDADALRCITGGIPPGAWLKILTHTTTSGRSALDQQPYYVAQQQAAAKARTQEAVAAWKAANPNWQTIVNPSPFVPRPTPLPQGLASPFAGLPQLQ